MEKSYIYVLKCPEGNIRYVGKTNNIKKRISSHISEAKKGKGRRYVLNWIQSLLVLDLKPLIEVIEECSSGNWQERERYWVEYYRKLIPNLCNNADGGLGGSGVKNYTETELETRRLLMSKRMSIYSEKERNLIWKMIQKDLDVVTIKQSFPKFTRQLFLAIKKGVLWNSITLLPKKSKAETRTCRIGYTYHHGRYIVRQRQSNGKLKQVFSSKNEKDVINYLSIS